MGLRGEGCGLRHRKHYRQEVREATHGSGSLLCTWPPRRSHWLASPSYRLEAFNISFLVCSGRNVGMDELLPHFYDGLNCFSRCRSALFCFLFHLLCRPCCSVRAPCFSWPFNPLHFSSVLLFLCPLRRSGGGAGMGSFSQVVGPGVHKGALG